MQQVKDMFYGLVLQIESFMKVSALYYMYYWTHLNSLLNTWQSLQPRCFNKSE